MIGRTPSMAWIMACATALMLPSKLTHAKDDGSQLQDRFRVNYAGYLPQANKTAIYLSDKKGTIEWKLAGTNCKGTESNYVSNDFASGDSFYRIDFSKCTKQGKGLTLQVGKDQSAPFTISKDPYGHIKYDFFDYFRDHEGKATFTQTKNDWQKDLNIAFSYVIDAGDNGVYPVNTAEASWALINMLETYPDINTYYSNNIKNGYTVYQQLNILTEQFYHVFKHAKKLAIPKFHTNVNDTYAACAPHFKGTCISEPETKATFATARTLAAMSRIHHKYGTAKQAKDAYQRATQALKIAQTEPLTCRQINSFGGEGGMYPDNDNYSGYRNPEKPRDNCHPGKNNTQDDEYAALVELYLAAIQLKQKNDIKLYNTAVTSHTHFNEVSSYWWGAVAMEGGLSLLTHEKKHNIDLKTFKISLLKKANDILKNQKVGYPGVTWDAQSNQWDSGDLDDVDNNFRWGSHRMALNDARILMAAAEVAKSQKAYDFAATLARGAVEVLDHISGINAMNLAMFTASDYPHIENAIMRTHDGANSDDSWSGKMVLGPNNWTNANDGAMPKFGSQPGLKMFAVKGTGWSSREISIDANASLVPVSYFSSEIAPKFFALSPIDDTKKAGALDMSWLWGLLCLTGMILTGRKRKVSSLVY